MNLIYPYPTPIWEIDEDLVAICTMWGAVPPASVGEMRIRAGIIGIYAEALSHPICETCGCGHPEDDEPNYGH